MSCLARRAPITGLPLRPGRRWRPQVVLERCGISATGACFSVEVLGIVVSRSHGRSSVESRHPQYNPRVECRRGERGRPSQCRCYAERHDAGGRGAAGRRVARAHSPPRLSLLRGVASPRSRTRSTTRSCGSSRRSRPSSQRTLIAPDSPTQRVGAPHTFHPVHIGLMLLARQRHHRGRPPRVRGPHRPGAARTALHLRV